jgi:mannose/fructose/N-acetylgalactosamine-specific phosphotransferase system component IIB
MTVRVRVDDRLVHGQVVVGWGRALGLKHLVLVDDEIRASAWEQDLYRMGVPAGMDIEFASLEEAVAGFPRWAADGTRTMVIVPDIPTLVALCEVADVGRATLGGIHQAEGRRERISFVFLSEEEAEQLRGLAARGIEIVAQAVPTDRAVPLAELLR